MTNRIGQPFIVLTALLALGCEHRPKMPADQRSCLAALQDLQPQSVAQFNPQRQTQPPQARISALRMALASCPTDVRDWVGQIEQVQGGDLLLRYPSKVSIRLKGTPLQKPSPGDWVTFSGRMTPNDTKYLESILPMAGVTDLSLVGFTVESTVTKR